MNKKIGIIFLLFFISLFFAGCATWQMVGAQNQWKCDKLEATLPEGWMRLNLTADLLFLTKDGEWLQSIRIFRFKTGNDKALPISKKKFTEEMLPQEISDLLVNEMSLDSNRLNFEVKENVPCAIGTKDGFKLQFTYNTADHLKLKDILYGFKLDKYVYIIQYQAAQQHYFDKDVADFEAFMESFRVF
ncbi:MAG: hypothetical protein PHN59_00355 [Candidatus Omnitrophica bacterium]|nr:hypothetical protein [Candidatus Omnitrophota bacterium]